MVKKISFVCLLLMAISALVYFGFGKINFHPTKLMPEKDKRTADGSKKIMSGNITPPRVPTEPPGADHVPVPAPVPGPKIIPAIPPKGISKPSPIIFDWPKYRYDKEMVGRSPGTAFMPTAPRLAWEYDISGWIEYGTVSYSPGKKEQITFSGHQIQDTDYFVNNKHLWGIGPPLYDLYGTGALSPVPESPAVKVADFIPERTGLEKIVVDSNYQAGDSARVRLYGFRGSGQELIWTSADNFPNCYGPVVCAADVNNDGQLDGVISMHYRLVVLDGASGVTIMNYKYNNQRNYGFLGIANIDDDPFPEFCIISDFAQHIEVIDNNGTQLSLKWMIQISPTILQNNSITQPGPDAFTDLDNDGEIEVVCSVYNYKNDRHWNILVFDALTGVVEHQLDNIFLNGLADVNDDRFLELFTTSTAGQVVPTYGRLSIYQVHSNSKAVCLWKYQNARFHLRELECLPLTVNTMAVSGRASVVHGRVNDDLNEDFFVSEIPAGKGGEICRCFGFDEQNRIRNWYAIKCTEASQLNVLAVAKTDGTKSEPAAVLFAIKNGHELNMRLSTIDCKFELKERIRNVPHNAGPPIVADLEGDGTMEIIVCSDNDEIICMEAPRLQEKRPRVRWRMKGLGMAKDAATKQDGVLVSDLDGDGVKEAVFSQETADGQASIIAVEPNGQIKWRHVFKGFDGSKPVWNLGGITYWVAGNFTTMKHQDLYVTIRRNKMHSDVGFLLSGLNGNVLWERDRIEIPNGNLVWDIRGHGGDRIAGADMDQDGIDEIVCAYPDRVFIVNGKKGEPTVIKNTINSLFPEEIAYYAVPVVADFNGDRKPEILYGRSGYLTALLDSGCKLIWKRDYNAAGTNGCNFLQGAGDWDGDGEIEIGGFYKSLAGEGYEFRFYKGLSGDLLAAFPLGTAAPCTDVVTADLDRDGSDEFLFSQGISIICMGNKGIKWSVDTGFTPGDIALADSDADGNLEIIVCTLDGYLKVYN